MGRPYGLTMRTGEAHRTVGDGLVPSWRARRAGAPGLSLRFDHAIRWVVGSLFLVLWTQAATPSDVDLDALEFRHGVSQFADYDLKYPPDFAHFDYVNPEAPKGGTLVLPVTYTMDSVSPTAKPPGFFRSYDHLLERAGDELSGYYGGLAESMALSADQRTMVFRLRPEARWHDGTPITATDVKFSLDTFRGDYLFSGWASVLE